MLILRSLLVRVEGVHLADNPWLVDNRRMARRVDDPVPVQLVEADIRVPKFQVINGARRCEEREREVTVGNEVYEHEDT